MATTAQQQQQQRQQQQQQGQQQRRRREGEGEGGSTAVNKEDTNEPIPWIRRKVEYFGPFRVNIKHLLKLCTADTKATEDGIWGYTLKLTTTANNNNREQQQHETILRIYEESTEVEGNEDCIHCDCCKCIGWHHHPVNKKQWHFIVHTDFKTKGKPELAGKRVCQLCCCAVPKNEKVCTVCGEIDKQCSIVDHQTHLLHGLLHGNGCGHLKRINGREAGSMVLSGSQLMGLWENICYTLRAREVSVEDVSQKYGVEYRLLNPASSGNTWYGTYGYVFGKGSFGNTVSSHKRAGADFRTFPLKHLRSDFVMTGGEDDPMVYLIDKYVNIFTLELENKASFEDFNDDDEGALLEIPKTLGDLVKALLLLQRNIRREVKEGIRPFETLATHGVGAVLAGISDVAKNRPQTNKTTPRRHSLHHIPPPPHHHHHQENGTTATNKKRSFQEIKKEEEEEEEEEEDIVEEEEEEEMVEEEKKELVKHDSVFVSAAKKLKMAVGSGLASAFARTLRSPTSLSASLQHLQPTIKQDPLPKEPMVEWNRGSLSGNPNPAAQTRWTLERVNVAANACVIVLADNKGMWLGRQDVRNLARFKGVGDTGLLDHVLKTIADHPVVMDGKNGPKDVRAKVRRRNNPTNAQLEYQLEMPNSKISPNSPSYSLPPDLHSLYSDMPIVEAPEEKFPTTESVRILRNGTTTRGATRQQPGRNQRETRETTTTTNMNAAVTVKTENKSQQQQQPSRTGTKSSSMAPLTPQICSNPNAKTISELTAYDVDKDLRAVYQDCLESYKPARVQAGNKIRVTCKGAHLTNAARVLLDTKQFVKTYVDIDDLLHMNVPANLKNPKPTRVLVTAIIDRSNSGPKVSGLGGAIMGKNRRKLGVESKPPPEIVLLPVPCTLGDLKREATKAFADLYVILTKFKISTIKGYENLPDSTRLNKNSLQHAHAEALGEGADLESEFRYQGGLDQWVVKCHCGTNDDDGERMIACDLCEIWMHTRCVGIDDEATTPKKFTCHECAGLSITDFLESKKPKIKKARPGPRERN